MVHVITMLSRRTVHGSAKGKFRSRRSPQVFVKASFSQSDAVTDVGTITCTALKFVNKFPV
jgi:hypothetical protein